MVCRCVCGGEGVIESGLQQHFLLFPASQYQQTTEGESGREGGTSAPADTSEGQNFSILMKLLWHFCKLGGTGKGFCPGDGWFLARTEESLFPDDF